MELQIKTLTPLWTGGVDRNVDRIHETGILGSLRWWYEAIVRGLGGEACDPTTPSCIYDPDKPDNGLCDVCQIFGATGWRRRFRLDIVDGTQQDTSSPKQISANRPVNPKTNRKPTWWFPDYPRSGNLTVQIQSLVPDFPPEVIAGLVQFIADWAAIGARAQMGFGVIELGNGRVDTRPLYDWLIPVVGRQVCTDLPSLRNIFLARISPKDDGRFNEQDTFNLKYDLRQLFANDSNVRHFVMGKVYMSGPRQGQRIATKVKMSRPYNGGLEMRVWGWIPEQADACQRSWNRDAVVADIHTHLSTNYTLQVWREMGSTRDTATPNNGDAQAFLRDLLAIEEEDDAA
jgi:CRISPR-associated protein Cmr1